MAVSPPEAGHIPPHPRRARWIVLVVGLLLTIILVSIVFFIVDSLLNRILAIVGIIGLFFGLAAFPTFKPILNDLFDWLDKWIHRRISEPGQMWQWVRQKAALLWALLATLIVAVLLFVLFGQPFILKLQTCNPASTTGCAIVNVNGDPIGLRACLKNVQCESFC